MTGALGPCVVKEIRGDCLYVSTLDNLAHRYYVVAKHFQYIPTPAQAPVQSTDDLIAENKSLQKQIGSLEERLARKKEFFKENKRIIFERVEAI